MFYYYYRSDAGAFEVCEAHEAKPGQHSSFDKGVGIELAKRGSE